MKRIIHYFFDSTKQEQYIEDSFERIYCILLALSIAFFPFLNTYSFPLFTKASFGEIIALVFAASGLFLIVFKKKEIKINFLLIFLIYSFIISAFCSLFRFRDNIGFSFARILRDAVFFLLYGIVVPSILKRKYLINAFKVFFVFLFIGLIIQMISHYLFKHDLFLLIKFFPLNYIITDVGNLEYHLSYSFSVNGFRFTSFLLEPSYCSYFVGFFLACILGTKENGNVWWAVLASFFLIMLKSFTGIILLVVFWVLFLISTKRIHKKHKIIIFLVLGVVFLSTIITVRFYFPKYWKRILEVVNPSLLTSGGFRIYRGFFIFDTYGLKDKIFGTGLGNLIPYLKEQDLYNRFITGASNMDYSSSFSYVLLSCGFIGFILFWLPFAVFVWKKKERFVIFSSVAFLLIMFDENISLSIWYVLFLSAIFCVNGKKANYTIINI